MATTKAPSPFSVIVHPFHATRRAYEHVIPTSSPAQNALVFIGGLGDGPHTVGYPQVLAQHLSSAASELSYSLFEIRLSSSFTGFGYYSLKHDAKQISGLVKYLRSIGRKKIVLMGHSTGCQGCMEYANYEEHKSEPVDGFILQAPVSDREAFGNISDAEELKKSIATAKEMIAAGKDYDIMPRDQLPKGVVEFFSSPISAYRWNSLVAPGGDDDYFSSDLDDATLAAKWERFQKPVLAVPSAEDEFVSKSIDQAALVKRWSGFCSAPGAISDLSAPIPGASHNVQQPEAREWLADRVAQFLEKDVVNSAGGSRM